MGKHADLCRYDLGIALLNDSSLIFFHRPSEAAIEHPVKLLPVLDDKVCSQDIVDLIQAMDIDLATN